MNIKKIVMVRPPVNTKIIIGNEECKCIKHENKTWINIKDLTLKGREQIYNLIKTKPGLLDYIIELSLYGQGDYYIEASTGLNLLNKAIDENDFWY